VAGSGQLVGHLLLLLPDHHPLLLLLLLQEGDILIKGVLVLALAIKWTCLLTPQRQDLVLQICRRISGSDVKIINC